MTSKMENVTKNENFFVLDWRIKNFSCWNCETHEKVITSSKSRTNPNFWMELYPRGLGGRDKHLIVRLCCEENRGFCGDLSYIGSDGYPLFIQQVNSKEKLSVLELPSGPEFEKVVAQIRKEEALQKDLFTLRYREKNNLNFAVYVCTSIDEMDASFKISTKLLALVGTTSTSITTFQNPLDNEMPIMILDACKDPVHHSKIKLALKPVGFGKSTYVRTHVVVINSDYEMQRTEKREHLFCDSKKWTFFDSLNSEEVIEKRFSLNLHIKIIPSKKYRDSFVLTQHYPQEVVVKRFNNFSYSSTTGSPHKGVSDPKNPQTVLLKELMCLYQDQDFSDFQLKCGEVTFPVHRAILSARSPIFKTMLSCDMREAVSGCMDVEDLDPSTLARFLAFLYTGALEDLAGESALKLYYAADKYQVASLKKECADLLSAKVSFFNVCDILTLADKHQDDSLTSAAHDFILNNYNDVLSSEDWAIFMRKEPILALQTVTHFAKKKYVKKSDVI